MGIVKDPNSKDVMEDSESDTRWLDNTPSIPQMAFQGALSNTMDTSERNLIPTSTTNEPDSARLHTLSEKI